MTPYELGIKVAQQRNVSGHLKQAYAQGLAEVFEKRAFLGLGRPKQRPQAPTYTPPVMPDFRLDPNFEQKVLAAMRKEWGESFNPGNWTNVDVADGTDEFDTMESALALQEALGLPVSLDNIPDELMPIGDAAADWRPLLSELQRALKAQQGAPAYSASLRS